MTNNSMRLFADRRREDLDWASHAEASFDYLNRSAKPEAQRIRDALERWFSNLPKNSRRDLKNRLCSSDDETHVSAAFELALHEILFSQKFSVELHPQLVGCDPSRPDFLVTTPSGFQFVLEALVATGSDTCEKARGRVLDMVYEETDKLESRDFFITVDVEGHPATQPSGRKIRAFLDERLRGVDVDELSAAIAAGGYDRSPIWRYEHEGLVLDFSPIPKSPSRRGTGDNLIGGIADGGGWLGESVSSLLKPLKKKANKFSGIDLPLVLAVNSLDPGIRRHGFELALFGSEAGSRRQTYEALWRWGAEGVPIRTRVSAVLAFTHYSPWAAAATEMILYINPWASERLPETVPAGFSCFLDDRERIRYESGSPIWELLNLWPGWPSQEASDSSTVERTGSTHRSP